MTITVEDFLEHHGVKGQQWGVRKQKIHDFGKKHEKGLKIVGGIAGAAVVVAGGVVAARHIMNSRGNITVKNAVKLTPPSIRSGVARPFGRHSQGMTREDASWMKTFLEGHNRSMAGNTAADRTYQLLQRQHNDVRDRLKPNQFMRFNNVTQSYEISKSFGWNPNNGKVGLSTIIR